MRNLKRFLALALVAVMLPVVCLPALSNRAEATSFSGVKGPTLVKSNGVWYYVKDGQVCNVTTLVKYNGSWWYVVNGKVASNTTTLVKYNNEWWYYVNKGKVNTTAVDVSYINSTNYTYDSQGRLSGEYDRYFSTRYYYDSLGLLTRAQTTYGASGWVTTSLYQYNEDNRLSVIDYRDDSILLATTTFTYEADGSYWESYMDNEGTNATRYNSNGQMVYSETAYDGIFNRFYYEYNSNADVSSTRHEMYFEEEGTTDVRLNTYRYEYNPQGNPISSTCLSDDVELYKSYYTYNARGQVVQELTLYGDSTEMYVYTYDQKGNRLTEALYDIPASLPLK